MRHLILAASITMTLAATASIAVATEQSPSGASVAWTSDDPAVAKARALVAAGRYAEAEKLIANEKQSGDTAAREELMELIRRSRQEYTLDADALLAKLKPSIPDVTAADLERWASQGNATFKTIDGTRLFFSREPSNIFKLSQEARDRRDANNARQKTEDKKEEWALVKHLEKVVEEAERTGKTEVAPVHHRIKYTVSVTPGDAGGKEGSKLRVWLPYPQEYRQQKNVKLIKTDPEGGFIAPTAVDGFPIKGAPQRTVYFEQTVKDPKAEQKFTVEFEYDSYAYYPVLDDAKVQSLPSDFDQTYLAERPPHIVFSPEIRKAVAEAVGDETNPLAKVRKIYDYHKKHVRYAYEDEYCTIPSFAQKAITSGKGDCGIQGTLFITMCRCAGIPARWQSGWETKVSGSSMHDWAEFYVAPWGWLPADASYGYQPSNDPKVHDFYIGHQDAYRMIFNLDYGRELQPPKNSLRSEPADFQRGEVELDGKNLYFDQWNYKMEIHCS